MSGHTSLFFTKNLLVVPCVLQILFWSSFAFNLYLILPLSLCVKISAQTRVSNDSLLREGVLH